MSKICPVKKAAAEIRGGWDAWEDETKGLVSIDGVDYVCQNAVFLYSIRKMEFARHTLSGTIPASFFAKTSGKTRKQLYDELSRVLLADAELHVDAAANAVERAISTLHRVIIGVAYRQKTAPIYPLFEQDYSGDTEDIVNRYIDYANKIGAKITKCAKPKKDDKDPDIKLPAAGGTIESDKQLLEMELDVIRGVGFREGELVSYVRKLVEVELAILSQIENLTASANIKQ